MARVRPLLAGGRAPGPLDPDHSLEMQIRTFLIALLAGSLVASVCRADSTVYSQPASKAATDGYYIWESNSGPSTTYQTFDNFTLNASSNIDNVQWAGSYLDPYTDQGNPAQPNSTSFQITFYLDNGGLPGSAVSTSTVALADCHPTFVNNVQFQNSDGKTLTIPVYGFSAALPNPFTAAAGQHYWISFLSNSPSDTLIWAWYSGKGGDSRCVTAFGSLANKQNDCAFALQGTATSDPSVPSTFFKGESALGSGAYYLAFPSGDYFGYYSFLSDTRYIYHFDLGYEYCIDAGDGSNGIYFYDFKSDDFFYTSPDFPFPYLYDFNLSALLYYYPDPNNAGHYNTNGVRYFYNLSTGEIISK